MLDGGVLDGGMFVEGHLWCLKASLVVCWLLGTVTLATEMLLKFLLLLDLWNELVIFSFLAANCLLSLLIEVPLLGDITG